MTNEEFQPACLDKEEQILLKRCCVLWAGDDH